MVWPEQRDPRVPAVASDLLSLRATDCCLCIGFDYQQAKDGAKALFTLDPTVTAVIACNDDMAIGAVDARRLVDETHPSVRTCFYQLHTISAPDLIDAPFAG